MSDDRNVISGELKVLNAARRRVDQAFRAAKRAKDASEAVRAADKIGEALRAEREAWETYRTSCAASLVSDLVSTVNPSASDCRDMYLSMSEGVFEK